jgi:mannose/fructose/N-acetylgalactosamine-specific phosphotransferase system component IIB
LPKSVNMGGIHYAEKRKKYLSYVYLNKSEVADLMYLLDKGIPINCQDIPTGKKYDIRDLLLK